MDGNDLWGEGEEEGSRHILLSLSHLPLSLSLNIQMKELGKSQVFGSNLKPVGGFGSSLKPVGGLSIAAWGVQGADLTAPGSPRAPTLQEA